VYFGDLSSLFHPGSECRGKVLRMNACDAIRCVTSGDADDETPCVAD
jgi:hypothetical protein